MSIEIVLVPLALAAISAWQASRSGVDQQGRTICEVQTRMKDRGLLGSALRDIDASVTDTPDSMIARWEGVEATFRQDDAGIWQATFSGAIDVEGASSIVASLDVAYGKQVQQAVLARLRDRAPQAGMSVASETIEADSSVTLVLNVGAHS